MSKYTIFPRTDTTYCYICNAKILTLHLRGGKEELGSKFQSLLSHNFLQAQDLDVTPVTCSAMCLNKHHSLPKTRYHEELIPLMQDVQFDGGSFVGFPRRCGRPEVFNEHAERPINLSNYRDRASELEPLFQAWLFFGFLHEALGSQFFNRNDYIGIDENGSKILTIASLRHVMRQWMLSRSQSARAGDEHSIRLTNVIRLVLKVLVAIRFALPKFDKRLVNLITATGEIVLDAGKCIYAECHDLKGFSLFWSSTQPRGASQSQRLSFADKNTGATIALKTMFDRIERCRLESHDSGASRTTQVHGGPSHRTGCIHANCGLVRVDEANMQRICQILEAGTFPLLKLERSKNDSIEIDVISWEHGVDFIAISHVWAQGMGNEYDNSLQQCQVENLQKHVLGLWKTLFPQSDQTPLFWLDTFCCPISEDALGGVNSNKARAEKRFKDLSLVLMRTVYCMASAVLVIDTELENLTTMSCSSVEVLGHLFCSPWVTRLWTLQEGSLPEELWIQFRDRPLNADSLIRSLREVYRGIDMRDRAAAWNSVLLLRHIRVSCGRYAAPDREYEFFVTVGGLSKRAVTYKQDEPTCLATLFDLDTSAVLAPGDTEQRMKNVWEQLSLRGLIPRSFAFSSGKTLNLPGYSWAWSTFLQPGTVFNFHTNITLRGTATEKGLLIKASGFMLKMTPPLKGFDIQYCAEDTSWFPDLLNVQIDKSHWGSFDPRKDDMNITSIQEMLETPSSAPFWDTVQVPKKTFAMVRKYLSTEPEFTNDKEYLFVEIVDESESGLVCKRVCVGIGDTLTEKLSRCYTAAFSCADWVRDHDDAKALAEFTGPHKTEEDLQLRRMAHFRLLQRCLPENRGDWVSRDPDSSSLVDPSMEMYFQILLISALAGKCATVAKQYPETQQWYIG